MNDISIMTSGSVERTTLPLADSMGQKACAVEAVKIDDGEIAFLAFGFHDSCHERLIGVSDKDNRGEYVDNRVHEKWYAVFSIPFMKW